MSDERHVLITAELAGATVVVARRNLEYEEVDNCLFEPDYTIAGSTGFLLWPGTWVLLELLRGSQPSAPNLAHRVRGLRVLELGSGTGLAGLCAAAAGAHMCLTDLPSVVHGILAGNVARNAKSSAMQQQDAVPASSTSSTWEGGALIGVQGGSAATMPLDWSQPLQPQLDAEVRCSGIDASSADMLLACDVVWLKELLIPFRDTVVGLLQRCRPGVPCLLTFLDRAKDGSNQFSSGGEVAALFTAVGCTISTYHSQQTQVDGEQLRAEVMEITLTSRC